MRNFNFQMFFLVVFDVAEMYKNVLVQELHFVLIKQHFLAQKKDISKKF